MTVEPSRPRFFVIGVGNELRGDDAAGLEIARRVRALGLDGVVVQEWSGDLIGLLDTWREADRVTLVDAVLSGAPVGSVSRFDVVADALPPEVSSPVSSHGVGVAEVVALARALHRLPAALIVYAVEGQDFDRGAPLSPAVEGALERTVEQVVEELRGLGAPFGARR